MANITRFWQVLAPFVRRVSPRRRLYLYSLIKRMFRVAAGIAVVWSAVSILLNGSEFFTDKLPKALATVSRHLLLAKTLRPILIDRIADRELAYAHLCVRGSERLDLDGDGVTTDLLIEFRPRRDGKCTDEIDFGVVYAVMKETGWNSVWPNYTLLRMLTPQSYPPVEVGIENPMNFQGFGKFLVGSIYAASFTGWIVYGYANGELHEFGRYRPLGSDDGMESTQPFMQVGSRLFIQTQRDFLMLRITPGGEFIEAVMTIDDVIKRNNTAILLDTLTEARVVAQPVSAALVPEAQAATTEYRVDDDKAIEQCGYVLLLNGAEVDMTPRGGEGPRCSGEITVDATAQISPLIICEFTGFAQSRQFPWGYVPDSSGVHRIRCPSNDTRYGFELLVRVAQ